MKAVFEELNEDVAVFVVDNDATTYHLNISELPKDAKVGDVFEVEARADEQIRLIRNLPAERTRREQSAKAKREELLRRNQ